MSGVAFIAKAEVERLQLLHAAVERSQARRHRQPEFIMGRQRFIKQSEVAAPPEAVFAFHEQPRAVEALTPPWERVEVVEAPGSLLPGTRVVFKIFLGPFSRDWVAEHTEYVPPRLFADIQRRGPFAYWYHRHRFEPTPQGTTLMTDEVEYALPFGWLGELIAGRAVRAKLQKMFDYRHRVVAEQMRDQHAHKVAQSSPQP
jgi:ligand-binding SRPBCC domain-containing protein